MDKILLTHSTVDDEIKSTMKILHEQNEMVLAQLEIEDAKIKIAISDKMKCPELEFVDLKKDTYKHYPYSFNINNNFKCIKPPYPRIIKK